MFSHIIIIMSALNNYVITHIYKEGNRAAHEFAQIGHHLDKPCIWAHSPPNEVVPVMNDDAKGKIVFRRR